MSPRPGARELLTALAACAGACAHATATTPAAPGTPPPTSVALSTPATTAASATRTPAPEHHYVPRGVVADGDKAAWMRELALPDLPMRWYPRVSEYLERYRSDPRSHEIVSGWLRRL